MHDSTKSTLSVLVISPWYYIIPIICVLIIALIGLVYFLFRRFGLSRNYHFHETKKNKQHRKESGVGLISILNILYIRVLNIFSIVTYHLNSLASSLNKAYD